MSDASSACRFQAEWYQHTTIEHCCAQAVRTIPLGWHTHRYDVFSIRWPECVRPMRATVARLQVLASISHVALGAAFNPGGVSAKRLKLLLKGSTQVDMKGFPPGGLGASDWRSRMVGSLHGATPARFGPIFAAACHHVGKH